MSQEYTPGPWKMKPPLLGSICIYTGRKTIANSRYTKIDGLDEAIGNANLIAAAPDMLQALELALRFVPDTATKGDKYITEIIEAVISKSRGLS